MDDPWGSPWADEQLQSLPTVEGPTSKRPVTPVKPIAPLPLFQAAISPWGDDAGFGEWAALPATDEIETSATIKPEKAVSGDWQAQVIEDSPQEKTTNGNDNYTAWSGRAGQHDNTVNLRPESSELAGGQVSPDPWGMRASIANATTLDVLEVNGNDSSVDGIISDGVTEEFAAIFGEKTSGENSADNLQLVGVVESTSPRTTPSVDDGEVLKPPGESSITTDAKVDELARGESLASRPSSSPSDRSHHDEVGTDSPRTSFEEDDKRPKLEQQGSSKFEELEHSLDGVAFDNAALERRLEEGNVSEDSLKTPIAPLSEDDFGDFEEGMSRVTSKYSSKKASSTNLAETRNENVKDAHISRVETEDPDIKRSDREFKVSDSVDFVPDLSLLDQIFVKEASGFQIEDADPKGAPELDSVIYDSFSSTDQRKTWYRISRYGTMRKHNAGDEENYVRTNWKDSEVRAGTLKIVARWMEEDLVGGRVILGGGTKLGSMFGWGQKNAAPISIATALASKRKMQPSQGIRIFEAERKRTSLEQISTSKRSIPSPSSANLPHFSWSSGSPVSASSDTASHSTHTPTSPITHRENAILPPPPDPPKQLQSTTNSKSRPKSLAFESPPDRAPQQIVAVVQESGKNAASKAVFQDQSKDIPIENEDEWGDMVSSPTKEGTMDVSIPSPIQKTRETCTETMPEDPEISTPRIESSGKLGTEGKRTIILSPLHERSPSKVDIEPIPTNTNKSAPDALSSADLSFFDIRAAAPVPSPSIPISSLPGVSAQNPNPRLLSLPALSQQQQLPTDQDRLVHEIVRNLPNLSYMLRR